MNKSIILMGFSLLALAGAHLAGAEESRLQSTADRDSHQWQSTDGNMSPEDYRQAYQHNQHVLFDQLKTFSENALHSIGVSKTGTKYLGAAAGLAVNQEAKLHLNKSKSLALEFTDIGEEDRAVMFGFSLDW